MWKWLFGSNLNKKVDMLNTYATALAYCFVLSVVPFMVVAFTITTHLLGPVSTQAYQATLSNVLPVESGTPLKRLITTLVESTSTGAARTIGLLVAVYTSFNLMTQIVRTLLFIFDDSRRTYEWNWKVFIKTLSLFAVWTFLLLVLTVSSVLSFIVHNSASFWAVSWRISCELVGVVSLFFAFFVTYFLVPSKRHRLADIRNGALVASVGWILCSLFFTHEVPRLMGVSMVYQALGSVVMVLLWAQACAWSVIVGACWIVRFAAKR